MNKLEKGNNSSFDAWFQKNIVLIIGSVLLLAVVAIMFMLLTIIKKITLLQSMNQLRLILNGSAKFVKYIYMIPMHYSMLM